MNKNRVKRHGMTDKLAKDSKVQKGSKQSHVNAARVGRKLPYLIRGGLPMRQKSAEAIVAGGVTSTQGGWGNSSTGRRAERKRS